MKINSYKIGGIRYIHIIGPQSFVNDATKVIKQANAGEHIEQRMYKLAEGVYRSVVQIEPWENFDVSNIKLAS